MFYIGGLYKRIKGEICLSYMTKSQYMQKIHTQHHINATKIFYYTEMTDLRRSVRHPNRVVYRFIGPTFPLPTTVVQSKGHTFKKMYISL